MPLRASCSAMISGVAMRGRLAPQIGNPIAVVGIVSRGLGGPKCCPAVRWCSPPDRRTVTRMLKTLRGPAVVCATAVLLITPPASASNLSATCANLQTVLSGSGAGDVITLDDQGAPCPGPITLPNHGVTLQGAGGGATLTGDNLHTVVVGSDIGATTLKNLTIRDGHGTGGAGGGVSVNVPSAQT